MEKAYSDIASSLKQTQDQLEILLLDGKRNHFQREIEKEQEKHERLEKDLEAMKLSIKQIKENKQYISELLKTSSLVESEIEKSLNFYRGESVLTKNLLSQQDPQDIIDAKNELNLLETHRNWLQGQIELLNSPSLCNKCS